MKDLNHLQFRKSTYEDLDDMARIADEGKASLKARGINQWQRGNYPNRDLFQSDVDHGIGYVVTSENKVVAICAVTLTREASYDQMAEGSWLTDDDSIYATIHRCATTEKMKGKGIASYLFSQVAEYAKEHDAKSIRIDTHPENLSMQHALEKSGFQKCGLLYLVDGDEVGDPRFGYEFPIVHS